MKTIQNFSKTTIEINKSIFITYLNKASTQDVAKEYIKTIKELHKDATHVVSAYLVGLTGEAGHYSDDGEPSGTAGLPVLDVFKKNDITNFVVCVVRYFGGVKLGAGGLIRAYSQSASTALKESGVVDIIIYERLSFIVDYQYINIIDKYISEYKVIEKTFSDKVNITIELPKDKKEKIKNLIISLTNNQVLIS